MSMNFGKSSAIVFSNTVSAPLSFLFSATTVTSNIWILPMSCISFQFYLSYFFHSLLHPWYSVLTYQPNCLKLPLNCDCIHPLGNCYSFVCFLLELSLWPSLEFLVLCQFYTIFSCWQQFHYHDFKAHSWYFHCFSFASIFIMWFFFGS